MGDDGLSGSALAPVSTTRRRWKHHRAAQYIARHLQSITRVVDGPILTSFVESLIDPNVSIHHYGDQRLATAVLRRTITTVASTRPRRHLRWPACATCWLTALATLSQWLRSGFAVVVVDGRGRPDAAANGNGSILDLGDTDSRRSGRRSARCCHRSTARPRSCRDPWLELRWYLAAPRSCGDPMCSTLQSPVHR
jgi:hypothetical protein